MVTDEHTKLGPILTKESFLLFSKMVPVVPISKRKLVSYLIKKI